MSTTQTPSAEAAHAHAAGHDHPTVRDYVRIGAILAVLTALEVSVHFIELPGWLVFWGLVVLAIAKFVIVAGWYMHLKFDAVIYGRIFGFGVVLACVVFALFLVISILGTPGTAQAAGAVIA